MRKANVPGQKSVVSNLLGKFAPAQAPDKSKLSSDQIRQAEADRGKEIAERDGLSTRAYVENRPGNVSHQPDYGNDDRDVIIKEAGKVLIASIQNKIGKGGIAIEAIGNGFKVAAAVNGLTSQNNKVIKRARAVFKVEFSTPMPNVKRAAFASVEFDANRSVGDQYKVAEHLVDAEDVNHKIAMMAEDISNFINNDTKRFQGSDELKRMASRQENIGENPYDSGRKLVIRDWTNPEITAFKRIAVRNVEKAVAVLKANGIEVQKRVFDKSHGLPDVTGPVYEITAASSQYKQIDSMLRSAGEFTTPSREIKNDEAKNKSRGEVFSNEEQIDDPSKFPGRSSEKEKPSYKQATPEKMAGGSEGKAFDEKENDDPKKWPGRSTEKNDEGVKGKLPRPKVKSDEKPNKEGPNPNMPGPGSSDAVNDWPNRSLEAGGTLGVGEMMKYDMYKYQRTAQMNATPLGSYQMDTPLGSSGQEAPPADMPMGGAGDEIGNLMDQPDVGIASDEGGQVVLLVPKDKLIDLAGTSGGASPAPEPAPISAPPAPPGGMTTPEDKGLPGAQAQKKQAEGGGKIPMPQGPAKVQEAPKVPKSKDKMDGMSHGKSAAEGNTPKIVPTEEFKKNPPKARMAFLMRFDQASTCFSAAQRLAVKAAEAANGGNVLSRQQFADATRVAQYMVGKSKKDETNKYILTLAHLPKNDALATFIKESMQKTAVPGGSGGAPNAKAPSSKGKEDSMDGLDHGKSDAGDSLGGYKTSSEPEAKANEAGGINKNPEDPNVSKDDDEMDGLSHGKSSGGTPKVTPSADYKGANPVKPMKSTSKFKDFREELLSHLTGAGMMKNPHKVFASINKDVEADYQKARAGVMDRFAKFEINDVEVTKELEQIDTLKQARLTVSRQARQAIYRKAKRASKKIDAKDGKPDPGFKIPDDKNKYNHQDDQWWDRTLEKSELPAGHVGEMGLKEDEDKAYDEKLYDDSTNFVGRTVEKSGGVPAKPLHSLREDEGKAFDENLYDNPKDWVGRSADKGWSAPTSNDYMLKTESKKEIESAISKALDKRASEYTQPEFDERIASKMLEIGGLVSKKSGSTEQIIETGANQRRVFCYGTRSTAVLREIVDLNARGLKPHEITYRFAQKEPDTLINVVDVIDGFKEAKSLINKTASKKKLSEGSRREAAGSEDYNKRSYDEDRDDDIASNMPEQKSWQKGESSEADPKKGRSDQPGDLTKDQRPQPTISSQEKENQKETKGYDWKKESAANPFAVKPNVTGQSVPSAAAAAAAARDAEEKEKKEKGKKLDPDVLTDRKDEEHLSAPTPKVSRKKAQVNEDVLPQEHRDRGTEQQFGMVSKHMQPGNNVTYAANDTVYDNTGRFPKADPSSPYTVAHVVEQVLIGLDKRLWGTAQEALDGIAAGERFGRLSQGQLSLITKTLSAHGFKLTEPKARRFEQPTALKK